MPVKIRLMRIGSKKRPFYRVVAVDERRKRTGGYLELLGTYNPLTEPKEIKLNQPKIDEWIKKGAVMSTGFLRIIGKAPQRFRKPKKEVPPEAPAVESVKPVEPVETSEEPAESTDNTDIAETPVENPSADAQDQGKIEEKAS